MLLANAQMELWSSIKANASLVEAAQKPVPMGFRIFKIHLINAISVLSRGWTKEWGTKPNVYYIPPKWYEAKWPKLAENDLFLAALAQREKDLLEPKNAAIESTKKVIKTAGILGSPFGAMLAGAAGAGLTLDFLAKRKAKVAAEEADKKQLTLPE
jgi:hypothetical protein